MEPDRVLREAVHGADQEMSFFEGALETAFVATEHFQTMLKGNELRIYTDYAPLMGAMSYLAHGPSEDDGRMTDSMRRKLEYISQYTMIIKYRIQCCDKCREENSDDEEWPPPERLGNYPTRTESGRAHTATPVPDRTSPRFTETGLESWCPFDRHTILTPDMQQMWDEVEAEVRQERKKISASHQRTKAGLSDDIETAVIHVEPPLIDHVYRSVAQMGRRSEQKGDLTLPRNNR